MTEDRLPLADLLAKAGDGDFLRSVAEAVVQLLIETDVEGLIGAGRHERLANVRPIADTMFPSGLSAVKLGAHMEHMKQPPQSPDTVLIP